MSLKYYKQFTEFLHKYTHTNAMLKGEATAWQRLGCKYQGLG